MGLIKRLKRITFAKIELFLQTMEDPEIIFPGLIVELEARLADACRAEAKALTAIKAAQKRADELSGRLARLGRAAELALEKGDEALAKEALAAQMDTEQKIVCCRQELARTELALGQAGEARGQIQGELEELKSRKQEILSRARLAKVQKQVWKSATPGSNASILDAVSAMEMRLAEDEAFQGLQHETSRCQSVEERLKKLERQAEVEIRLQKLRKNEK